MNKKQLNDIKIVQRVCLNCGMIKRGVINGYSNENQRCCDSPNYVIVL